MVEELALACRRLVLARRAQQAGQQLRKMLESTPSHVFTPDEWQAMADSDARDQKLFTDALDRVNLLTGSPAVGAVVLERANALIRAEDEKLRVATARMALIHAPADALTEPINESEAFLREKPGCPVTTAQLERAREVLADIQQAGLHRFAELGSLSS